MEIVLKSSDELTPTDRRQLDDLCAEAFPPDGQGYEWSATDWYVLVREGEQLVSNVGIVARTVTVGSRQVKLGGIGGVATLVAWRRRGLAEAALKVAQSFMRRKLAADFGLLVCGQNMIPYYSKFGWKLVGDSMLIDQHGRKVTYTGPIMILPVCQSEWPEGPIDLCGKPW